MWIRKTLRIWIGNVLRALAEKMMPDYWRCTNCGLIKFREEEVHCWNCAIGEMIYKGK